MDEQVGDSVATERFQAIVLTSFGAAALLLALLGVYGVLVYSHPSPEKRLEASTR
jgi:hypothetical protein